MSLDEDANEERVVVSIEVATVRYKHAMHKLQATIPNVIPQLVLVLEPQLAEEHNSMPHARMASGGSRGGRGGCTCRP